MIHPRKANPRSFPVAVQLYVECDESQLGFTGAPLLRLDVTLSGQVLAASIGNSQMHWPLPVHAAMILIGGRYPQPAYDAQLAALAEDASGSVEQYDADQDELADVDMVAW